MRRLDARVAPSLVMAEALAGAALLTPATVPIGFMLSTGLFAAFSVIILSLIRRGREIACSCFGSRGAAPMGRPHLVRAVALSLAAASCLVTTLLGVTISFDDYVTPVPWVGGLALALVSIRIEDVAYVFGRPEQTAK
ncbi:MauE/DoxX family redox-associated membrane protein [Salinispora pacifica]|uniref:MauE/DoxX family redox-associated membrane protein n=1 Tax=Salinispora pacifica TaxID=351187 RepID=UPI003B5098CD